VTPNRFGDRRRIRIGILGGSFNPAHEGHLHIARAALRRLRLDQVWLLVSPGNPLKRGTDMAPLAERLASAARLADGRRIIATDIERHFRACTTRHSLAELQRRFPRAHFLWLMGADNLVQLPRWHRWLDIVRSIGFAVLPRPAYRHRFDGENGAYRRARPRCLPICRRRPGYFSTYASTMLPPPRYARQHPCQGDRR
jgi:nicotinate-nucleotide adenylyltransferase